MTVDPTADLTGASWTLVSYRLDRRLVTALARDASLELGPDGSASGGTGCNRFFGRWEGDASRLTVLVAGMTQMACDEVSTAQERAVLDALGAVAGWRRTGRALVLTDEAGEVVLTFEGVWVGDLAGSAWVATGVNNGRQAVVSSARTEALTLELDREGRVSGSAGCNRFTGTYELAPEGGIRLGPLATTRKLCPDPEVMALEQEYLAALQRAAVVELSGERLGLRDADGATQATFRRAG